MLSGSFCNRSGHALEKKEKPKGYVYYKHIIKKCMEQAKN